MMKKIFQSLEYIFTISSLILYTGGIINVLALDGLSEGEVDYNGVGSDSSRFAIVKILYPITYVIAFLLIVRSAGKSSKVGQVLFKNLNIVILVGLTAISIAWSELPMVTLSRATALIGTTIFGIYLAHRYTLKEQLTLLSHTFFAIAILSIGFAVALPQYGLMGGLHVGAMRGIYPHKNEFGRLMALGAIVFLMQPKASFKFKKVNSNLQLLKAKEKDRSVYQQVKELNLQNRSPVPLTQAANVRSPENDLFGDPWGTISGFFTKSKTSDRQNESPPSERNIQSKSSEMFDDPWGTISSFFTKSDERGGTQTKERKSRLKPSEMFSDTVEAISGFFTKSDEPENATQTQSRTSRSKSSEMFSDTVEAISGFFTKDRSHGDRARERSSGLLAKTATRSSEMFSDTMDVISGFFVESEEPDPEVMHELPPEPKVRKRVNIQKISKLYYQILFKYVGLGLAVTLAILSRSSGAIVNLAILMIFLSILKIGQLQFHHKFIAIVGAIVLFGIASILFAADPEALFASMGKSSDLTGRGDLWEVLLEMLSQNPLFGFGYGAFWEKFRPLVALQAGWNAPDAHNGFLDLALSVGLVGLGIFAIGYFSIFIKSFIQFRHQQIDEHIYPLILLTYILIGNISETGLFTSNNTYWLLYTMISYSIVSSSPKKASPRKKGLSTTKSPST